MLWLGVVGSSIEVLFFPKVRVHKCRVGQIASAGNRTRVTSMATMYSTTRPLMLIGTLEIGALAFWLRAKSQYVVVVVVCMQLCRRGCVCVWKGIPLSANGVVGVDGMFHAEKFLRLGKTKLSPIFLALLHLSSGSAKDGILFSPWRAFSPPFFFPLLAPAQGTDPSKC